MIMFGALVRSLCGELQSHQSNWGTPQVGSLCAAIYSVDNDWYRARVEEMIGSDEVCSVKDILIYSMTC